MRRLNWSALVRNIENRRAPKAKFFKPVCVIAAIDLADEGLLDARNISGQAIINRFDDYVTPFHKDRGDRAYQPLWRLRNDGLWNFYSRSKLLDSDEFAQGNPNTEGVLLSKIDRISISEDYIDLWNIPKERRSLRDYMLIMLYEGDSDSKKLVAPLFNPKNLLDRARYPNKETLSAYFQTVRDQLRLFHDDELRDLDRGRDKSFLLSSLKKDSSSLLPAPDAVENIPSPIDYVWSDSKITIGPNSVSVPNFPHLGSRRTFEQRLEACRVEAKALLRDLKSLKWQVRSDYQFEVAEYLERLPTDTRSGNILLADATMRTLRDIFKSDMDGMPAVFAARLKTLMQQHIGIRPFYPEVEEFYRAVKTGKIEEPLPIDSVYEIIDLIKDRTPEVFDESVSSAMDEVSVPKPPSGPDVTNRELEAPDSSAVELPADPLGDIDIEKSQNLQTAGNINRLWKVFKSGESVHSTAQSWVNTYNLLAEPVSQVINWIINFRA